MMHGGPEEAAVGEMQSTSIFNLGGGEFFFLCPPDQPVTMNAYNSDADMSGGGVIHDMGSSSECSARAPFLETHQTLLDVTGEAAAAAAAANNDNQLEVFAYDEQEGADQRNVSTMNPCMTPFSQSVSSSATEPQIVLYKRGTVLGDDRTWVTDSAASVSSNPAPFVSTPADLSLAVTAAITTATAMTATANSASETPKNNSNDQVTTSNDVPRFTARNNVYASELPLHWNTEELRNVCFAFGNIISAKVVHDSATNKSRGYGFVMFETAEQAAMCVRSLNNFHVDGKVLSCRLAHEKAMPSFAHADRIRWNASTSNTPSATALGSSQPNGPESIPSLASKSTEDSGPLTPAQLGSILERGQNSMRRSRNVFIQGLPLHWNTDKLRSLCGTCGKVELAKVVRDSITSLSCGHGFVLFEKEEHAALCVETFNGFVHEGRTLMCRLVRERRSTASPTSSSGGQATTTPLLRPANTSGKSSVVESLLVPPQKMLEPLGAPSAHFLPMTAYAKWAPAGVPPTCTTALVHPQHVTPPTSVFGFTAPTVRQHQDAVSAALGLHPEMPAFYSELTHVQGLEHPIAPAPAMQNAYFIALPYAAGRPNPTLGAVPVALSNVSPENMRNLYGGYP